MLVVLRLKILGKKISKKIVLVLGVGKAMRYIFCFGVLGLENFENIESPTASSIEALLRIRETFMKLTETNSENKCRKTNVL
jgi:hypothetical protein